MKIKHKRISTFLGIALATLVVTLNSTATSAPFSAKHVPAQADGVAHLDMDKLRASSVWKTIVDTLPKEARDGTKKDVGKQILKTLEDMGEDGMIAAAGSIMANTQSITVWGDDKDQWALLVELPQASTMLSLVDGANKLESSTSKGIKLYHLGDDAFLGVHKSTLVVSEKKDAAIATIRVLSGTGKSLATRKLGGLNANSRKGILFVAGFGGKLLETFKKSAASTALKADIRTVFICIGEKGGTYFAEAEAQVGSQDEASNLASVASGLLGLASLGNDDPNIATLIAGLSVKAKGAALHARLDIAKKSLEKMIADQTKP